MNKMNTSCGEIVEDRKMQKSKTTYEKMGVCTVYDPEYEY
jgi:hypothetical protein